MMRSRSQTGFSMLEMVVVLIIVGIVAAVVVPRMMGSMSNTKLKTATKKIAATLRFARSTAASEKATRTVTFDLDGGSMSLEGGKASSDGSSGDGTENGGGRAKTYDLPEEVRLEKAVWGEEFIESGTFEIHFFPNGGSSGGELILGNDRDRRYGVVADLITGMVRIDDSPEEAGGYGTSRSKGVVVVIGR